MLWPIQWLHDVLKAVRLAVTRYTITSLTSCALDLICPPSACREVWLQGHKRSPNQSAWTALLHLTIDLKMFGKKSEWIERVFFFNCLPIWRLQKDSQVEVLAPIRDKISEHHCAPPRCFGNATTHSHGYRIFTYANFRWLEMWSMYHVLLQYH